MVPDDSKRDDPVVLCAACDGYGWIVDEGDPFDEMGEGDDTDADSGAVECRWCTGIGYVYQDARGVARRIPPDDLALLSDTLEALELARLREIGYTGTAKQPRDQAIRIARGDTIARPPE
ncbi:MAG: hypothetical protein SGJ24_11070 [Chloroflexota bacterium]|nr:hypothetical protein [Chloroflexota bacterium]